MWPRLALTFALSVGMAFGAGELSNRRAPGFSLPDAEMKQHDPQDYRGKVVVVNIMRTGCPHCAAFSKKLGEIERKYAGKVKVLSVVNSHQDNQAAVRKYQTDNNLSGTILFDCGQMTASYLKLTPRNPTFEVPHFFVIDQQGTIREDYGYNMLARGIFEGDGLQAILDKYVSKADRAD